MASFNFKLADGNSLPGVGLGVFMMEGPDCVSAVLAALAAGYRHIDTAQSYNNEAAVGEGLKASGVPRESVYITTKLWPGNPAWGMPLKSHEEAVAACKASVADLGIETVDLLLVHAPFGGTEGRLGIWKALIECQKQGLAKSIGVCNYGIAHLEEIAAAGLPAPTVNQIELHPMTQKAELLAYMAEKKIQPIAYSSLALLESWRHNYPAIRGTITDCEREKAAPVATLATQLNVSPARVLLRYALQKGWAVLPKSTRKDRIKENFDLDTFSLNRDQMKQLDELEAGANFAWDAPPGQHSDLTTTL